MQRADLKSATGRRSAALRVQFLGGGVKLNKPKIGAGLATYKRRCCNAVMHLRIAKKETAPQRYTRWGGSILLQVEPTITAHNQKATP